MAVPAIDYEGRWKIDTIIVSEGKDIGLICVYDVTNSQIVVQSSFELKNTGNKDTEGHELWLLTSMLYMGWLGNEIKLIKSSGSSSKVFKGEVALYGYPGDEHELEIEFGKANGNDTIQVILKHSGTSPQGSGGGGRG